MVVSAFPLPLSLAPYLVSGSISHRSSRPTDVGRIDRRVLVTKLKNP